MPSQHQHNHHHHQRLCLSGKIQILTKLHTKALNFKSLSHYLVSVQKCTSKSKYPQAGIHDHKQNLGNCKMNESKFTLLLKYKVLPSLAQPLPGLGVHFYEVVPEWQNTYSNKIHHSWKMVDRMD